MSVCKWVVYKCRSKRKSHHKAAFPFSLSISLSLYDLISIVIGSMVHWVWVVYFPPKNEKRRRKKANWKEEDFFSPPPISVCLKHKNRKLLKPRLEHKLQLNVNMLSKDFCWKQPTANVYMTFIEICFLFPLDARACQQRAFLFWLCDFFKFYQYQHGEANLFSLLKIIKSDVRWSITIKWIRMNTIRFSFIAYQSCVLPSQDVGNAKSLPTRENEKITMCALAKMKTFSFALTYFWTS